MQKQITPGVSAITLVALALILVVKLVGPQMTVNVKARNSHPPNNQTTPSQTEKPFDQAQALADLRKRIAGQENKPAGEVFKNIQMLKICRPRAF